MSAATTALAADLAGKVVLVTGGASGIGAGIAQVMAARGPWWPSATSTPRPPLTRPPRCRGRRPAGRPA